MPSKIAWTDETWNPVRGCSRVSEGCRNCYAMRQARRQDKPGKAYEGLTKYSTTMGRDCDLNPVGIDHTKHQGVDWSGEVRFIEDRLGLPLRWRKPRHVFVDSMGDLFHPKVSDGNLDRIFAAMALAPRHAFQVLTKRPRRMLEYVAHPDRQKLVLCRAWSMLGHMPKYKHEGIMRRPWPLPNVWLGVSCEGPDYLDRLDHLRATPAAVRFVSFEPLLAPVVPNLDGIDWAIVGSEAGHGARPMDEDWVRAIRDECVKTGTPLFYKQRLEGGRKVSMPELDGRVWDQTPEVQ